MDSFGRDNLETIVNKIRRDDLSSSSNFSFVTMLPILEVVNKVCQKKCSRKEGNKQATLILMQLTNAEESVANLIKVMLQVFPLTDLDEVIKEDDLKSRFILPILQSLFDDLDSDNVMFF